MKYAKAAAVCIALFFAYGLFSLAMGWSNLGGLTPTLMLIAGLVWVWKNMTSKQ